MKKACGGPSTRKSYTVCLNYHNTHLGLTKRKLKVPLLKQTVRVHIEFIFRLDATRDWRDPVSGWGLEGSGWDDACCSYSLLWFLFLGLSRRNTCKKKSILKHIKHFNWSFKKRSTRRTKTKTQATPIEPRPRQTQLVKVWIKKENACRF